MEILQSVPKVLLCQLHSTATLGGRHVWEDELSPQEGLAT
jgi:hypothetical protein